MIKLLKLSLSTLLCGVMLLTPTFAFFDEQPSAWARPEVRAALDSSLDTEPITWENSDYGTYHASISRNVFCHIIGAVISKDKNQSTSSLYDQAQEAGYQQSFTDLSRVDWNYEVKLVHSLGIIDGVSQDKFDPYGILTREQAAKILAKTIITLRPSLWQEGKDYFADKTFQDQEEISSWAKNYVGFVVDQGLMNGVDGNKFAPQEPYTYEQALITCYRLACQIQVPGMLSTKDAGLWLDDYRIGRVCYAGEDLVVSYYGYADGIAKVTAESVTVDGVGKLSNSKNEYLDIDSLTYLNVSGGGWQMDSYYTAHVKLNLTMKDGSKKQITDTFVFGNFCN